MRQRDDRLDAVKMMREIRDSLSRELMARSHEEQRRYIEKRLREDRDPEVEDKPRRG